MSDRLEDLTPEEVETLRRWSRDSTIFDPAMISHAHLLRRAAAQIERSADARRAALKLAADHVLTQLTMAHSGMPADLILLAIDKTLRSDDFRALLDAKETGR